MMIHAVAILLLLTGARPALAQADDPSREVKRLYGAYRAGPTRTPSAVDLTKSSASRRLKALFDREERCTKGGELCNLEFDFIANGQDFQIAKVDVAPATVQGDKASVTARFTNFGAPNELVYSFVREGGRWRLDDVRATAPKANAWTLSKLLAK